VSTPAEETMQISERELLQMTRDLDEIHHDTVPKMHEAVADWTEINRKLRSGAKKVGVVGPSRRTFLLGAGAAVGVATLAACSKSSSLTSSTSSGGAATTAAPTGAGQNLTGDLAIAALGASLENLAVATYQAGLDAAAAGKLGAVPPAIATFAMTAQQQHKDHAAAWNSVLTGASKQAITGIDTTVNDAVVKPTFAQVKDVVGLAKLALALEDGASATYLNAINLLSDAGAIKIAASIQPVEMQHSAILNFVLGNYPIPDSFAKTDGARTPSDAIG
jgi:hypothetical protein